jgi:hypothetical protein
MPYHVKIWMLCCEVLTTSQSVHALYKKIRIPNKLKSKVVKLYLLCVLLFRMDRSFELARSSLIQKLRTKGKEKGMRSQNIGCAIKIHPTSTTKFKFPATVQPLYKLQKCALHCVDNRNSILIFKILLNLSTLNRNTSSAELHAAKNKYLTNH